MSSKKYPFLKTDEEWKQILNAEEYYILREKGTEKPFSGEFNNHFERGIYVCRACKQELYDSKSKFESSCGWPSYDESKTWADLIKALENGKIMGAGIDVTLEEPLNSDSLLWNLKNVIITPHSAGETRSYENNVLNFLIENLHRLQKGDEVLFNQIVELL